MSKKKMPEPGFAVHPGRLLARALSRHPMTQKELAERMGVHKKTINDIVNGTASISYDTAVGLERVLGIDASFWTNAESTYQIRKKRLDDLAQRDFFLKEHAIKELFARKVVSELETPEETLNSIFQFFGVRSDTILRSYFPENISLRKSSKIKSDPLALLCWLRCCELECEKVKCSEYDESKFKETLREIRSMTAQPPNNFFEQIQKMCSDCGVAVVAVPEFKGAAVNGAAQWRENKASIMMNLRGKYADIFWFSFFHEAGHILKGSKKFQYIEGWKLRKDYDQEQLEKEEKKADDFARNFLIPERFQKELSDLSNLHQIKSFAEKIGIHPCIVVGRLQNDGYLEHDKLNNLRPRFKWGKKE